MEGEVGRVSLCGLTAFFYYFLVEISLLLGACFERLYAVQRCCGEPQVVWWCVWGEERENKKV